MHAPIRACGRASSSSAAATTTAAAARLAAETCTSLPHLLFRRPPLSSVGTPSPLAQASTTRAIVTAAAQPARGRAQGRARAAFERTPSFSTSSHSSAASSSAADTIHMRGMTFHGYHGVLAEEKVLGQKFVVDVAMSTCMRAAGASDDLSDTVNYARAFDLVKEEVEGESRDLIECVSERIASRNDGETECAVCGACPYPPALLREFPTVVDVRVGVQKPHVAVTGVLGSLGVEIFRTR